MVINLFYLLIFYPFSPLICCAYFELTEGRTNLDFILETHFDHQNLLSSTEDYLIVKKKKFKTNRNLPSEFMLSLGSNRIESNLC